MANQSRVRSGRLRGLSRPTMWSCWVWRCKHCASNGDPPYIARRPCGKVVLVASGMGLSMSEQSSSAQFSLCRFVRLRKSEKSQRLYQSNFPNLAEWTINDFPWTAGATVCSSEVDKCTLACCSRYGRCVMPCHGMPFKLQTPFLSHGQCILFSSAHSADVLARCSAGLIGS